MSSQDPNAVGPGSSTYSLRSPDTVSAAAIPSMPMERVLPRQTSTGLARGIQQLGSPNVYVDSGNEQIVVAKTDGTNSSTPQVLMGNQVNKGEGFYVTKPGVDVTSASNDSDFIFNSNQNVFKIVKTLDISLSFDLALAAASFGISKVPHDLAFTPAYQAYITIDPAFVSFTDTGVNNIGNNFTLYAISGGTNLTPTVTGIVTADDTYVYFEIITRIFGSATVNNTARVYLQQESAN